MSASNEPQINTFVCIVVQVHIHFFFHKNRRYNLLPSPCKSKRANIKIIIVWAEVFLSFLEILGKGACIFLIKTKIYFAIGIWPSLIYKNEKIECRNICEKGAQNHWVSVAKRK